MSGARVAARGGAMSLRSAEASRRAEPVQPVVEKALQPGTAARWIQKGSRDRPASHGVVRELGSRISFAQCRLMATGPIGRQGLAQSLALTARRRRFRVSKRPAAAAGLLPFGFQQQPQAVGAAVGKKGLHQGRRRLRNQAWLSANRSRKAVRTLQHAQLHAVRSCRTVAGLLQSGDQAISPPAGVANRPVPIGAAARTHSQGNRPAR